MATAPRRGAGRAERVPRNEPIGVRARRRMTISFMETRDDELRNCGKQFYHSCERRATRGPLPDRRLDRFAGNGSVGIRPEILVRGRDQRVDVHRCPAGGGDLAESEVTERAVALE